MAIRNYIKFTKGGKGMFAYLKGTFEFRTLDYIVVDVNGIGYKIYMSENSMKNIGEIGTAVKVYTYLKVREDDISIYGFASNEELRMFELLVSVSGIGAKSAITILSNIEPSAFAISVITDDVTSLKKLPGIGLKSAQRIILELKDKLKSINCEEVMNENLKSIVNKNINMDELISALQVLGYTRKEIESITPKLTKEDGDLESMIKKALVLLSN